MSDAAAHDGARLSDLLDRNNTAGSVWADTAYRSKKNEAHMEKNGFVSRVHRKKPKGSPMPERTSKANGRKSKVRALVEHVFAVQKDPMDLFIRSIDDPAVIAKLDEIANNSGDVFQACSFQDITGQRINKEVKRSEVFHGRLMGYI